MLPGETDPLPFSVIVTDVALPPKVLSFKVNGATPQVVPARLLRLIDGPLTQPQDTVNELPVVAHPAAFLTVIECEPLLTSAKILDDWYIPLSNLYSSPKPVGLVTVTRADPNPRAQLILCSGAAGTLGASLIITSSELPDVHPCWLVTL